jgi:hypothetical protein
MRDLIPKRPRILTNCPDRLQAKFEIFLLSCSASKQRLYIQPRSPEAVKNNDVLRSREDGILLPEVEDCCMLRAL